MGTSKCLNCGNTFQPRHPAQRFCSKNSIGRHLCKDQYHNRDRARSGPLSTMRVEYLAEKAAKNEPDVWGMINQKLGQRLRMTSDDCECAHDGVITKNGVEVGPDFVGISDQEHEQIMDEMGDDF